MVVDLIRMIVEHRYEGKERLLALRYLQYQMERHVHKHMVSAAYRTCEIIFFYLLTC